MNPFKDIFDKIEAAKPHLHRGLSQADTYACRIIALLEDIASDDAPADDQRVRRIALVNGTPQQFETPQGEDWRMVALIVEPVGATTIRLSLGGVTRFAKQFAAADTPQVPNVVIPSGATLDLLSTGTDATVTIIAALKRRRPKLARGVTGDQLSEGLPLNDGIELDRRFTDEASELPPPPSDEDEIALQQTSAETTYTNAEPVL